MTEQELIAKKITDLADSMALVDTSLQSTQPTDTETISYFRGLQKVLVAEQQYYSGILSAYRNMIERLKKQYEPVKADEYEEPTS